MLLEEKLEMVRANAPARSGLEPGDWAYEVVTRLDKVNNRWEINTQRDALPELIIEAVGVLNPAWLNNFAQYMEPGKSRTDVKELQQHLQKLEYDLRVYAEQVPHAKDKATAEAAKMRTELTDKLKKTVGRYLSHKRVVV